jgi:hypothetical protein
VNLDCRSGLDPALPIRRFRYRWENANQCPPSGRGPQARVHGPSLPMDVVKNNEMCQFMRWGSVHKVSWGTKFDGPGVTNWAISVSTKVQRRKASDSATADVVRHNSWRHKPYRIHGDLESKRTASLAATLWPRLAKRYQIVKALGRHRPIS